MHRTPARCFGPRQPSRSKAQRHQSKHRCIGLRYKSFGHRLHCPSVHAASSEDLRRLSEANFRITVVTVVHSDRGRDVPRSQNIRDPGSPGCRIRRNWRTLDPIFLFSRGILGILDHIAETLSWDLRDLGSQTERMSLDPGDPGS